MNTNIMKRFFGTQIIQINSKGAQHRFNMKTFFFLRINAAWVLKIFNISTIFFQTITIWGHLSETDLSKFCRSEFDLLLLKISEEEVRLGPLRDWSSLILINWIECFVCTTSLDLFDIIWNWFFNSCRLKLLLDSTIIEHLRKNEIVCWTQHISA